MAVATHGTASNYLQRAPSPSGLAVVVGLILDNGLVVWPNVGHTNGVEGDLVMLAPPFTVTEAEIDAIVSRLVESINAAVAQVASHR